MGQGKRQDPGRFVGDGFAPASTNEVGDWGGSDGFSLWDAAEHSESGFEDWEGRQETHDMFAESYD